MTLEQLRLFVAVAERQHVTRAAVALRLTQAGVSAAIAALEAQHAVKLFDRVGRGIVLTQAGLMFLPEAKAVLARAALAATSLADHTGLRRGHLTLHASQTIASYFLPPILTAFRARYPGISLALAIGNTGQVARAVMEGAAALGFVEGQLSAPDLVVESLAGERMVVIVPPTHPWAHGAALTPADLRRADWVFREVGSGTRDAFLAALAEQGLTAESLNIVLTLPANEAVREAVVAGAGVACLSPLVCAGALAGGALRTANLLLPVRAFNAVRHRERYVSAAAAAFLAAARGALPAQAGLNKR